MIKRIGVLTSGGDCSGMNAVIKSIVDHSIKNNIKIFGIKNGYLGLYHKQITILTKKKVSEIIDKGGTFLGTSRFNKLKQQKTRLKIIKNLKKKKIDLLIVIGGEGSCKGAKKISKMSFPCITLPATIDNDIIKNDFTIGFFTALETIIEAIKKIKDTSSSHKRISIIEVMGRNCGDLALYAGISTGCNIIINKKKLFIKEKIIKQININSLCTNYQIIIVSENICNIYNLAKYIEKKTKIETRATSLGYIQRGGSPVGFDRILAFKMGKYVIKLIKKRILNKSINFKNGKISFYDINKN